MLRFFFASRWAFACLVVLVLPGGAWAESPDPLNAEAATPALDYQSPLNTYQSLGDQSLQDWREANKLVGRIGGWRTYAQEPYAQEPWAQPADNAAEAPAQPAEVNHDGHH